MPRKGGSGRKKTSLQKIENAANLQVTFAKRRLGILNKANEIGIICGAEVAVVLFSPAGKVFTFGHPNVDQVIERFVTQNPPQEADNNERMIEAHRQVQQLNLARQLSESNDLLDTEKNRGEFLNHILKLNEGRYPWGRPLEELNLQELDHFKKIMQGAKQNIEMQLDMKRNPAPFPSLPSTGHLGREAYVPFDASSSQPSNPPSHPGPPFAGPSGGVPFEHGAPSDSGANPSNWAPGSGSSGPFSPK